MHGYTRSLLQCPVWIPGTGTVYGEFGNKPFPIVNLFPRTRKKKEFLWFANSFFLVRDPFPPFRSGRTREKRTSVQTGIARSKRPLVRFKHPFLAHFLSVQNRPDSQKDLLIRQKSLWVGNVLLKGKKDFCLEKRRWEKVYCRAPCTGFWSHARHPVCAFAISTPRAPARAPSPAASVTTPSRPRKGHSQPRSRARG